MGDNNVDDAFDASRHFILHSYENVLLLFLLWIIVVECKHHFMALHDHSLFLSLSSSLLCQVIIPW